MDIEKQYNLWIGSDGFDRALEHLKLGTFNVDFEDIHGPNVQFWQQAVQLANSDFQ
jgi:hypothetical protein